MTPADYRDALARLGLSQAAAGRLFANDPDNLDAGERMSRRWAAGDSRIPRAVEIALTLMIRYRVKPERFMRQT